MFNYQRGDLTGIQWIPQGQGGGAFLAVKDQDLDLSSLLYDVTSTLAGGLRARLAGTGDAASTINAIYDADQSPWLPVPNIVNGAGGLLVFFLNAGGPLAGANARSVQVPMRIEKVHYKSGVETAVLYSFDAKMDSRVGALVYSAQ